MACSIYVRSIKVLGENVYLFQTKQNPEEKNVFLLQRVHLPCPALRSKAILVSQAFDSVQIKAICAGVTPTHGITPCPCCNPPLQWSLSTSTDQVLAKPFPTTWPLCCGSTGKTMPQGVPAGISPRDCSTWHSTLRIFEECKQPWIEKHGASRVGAQEVSLPHSPR